MNELKEKLKANIKYHIDRVLKQAHHHFLLATIIVGIKIFGLTGIPSLTN